MAIVLLNRVQTGTAEWDPGFIAAGEVAAAEAGGGYTIDIGGDTTSPAYTAAQQAEAIGKRGGSSIEKALVVQAGLFKWWD